jgi:hypothetical protein
MDKGGINLPRSISKMTHSEISLVGGEFDDLMGLLTDKNTDDDYSAVETFQDVADRKKKESSLPISMVMSDVQNCVAAIDASSNHADSIQRIRDRLERLFHVSHVKDFSASADTISFDVKDAHNAASRVFNQQSLMLGCLRKLENHLKETLGPVLYKIATNLDMDTRLAQAEYVAHSSDHKRKIKEENKKREREEELRLNASSAITAYEHDSEESPSKKAKSEDTSSEKIDDVELEGKTIGGELME